MKLVGFSLHESGSSTKSHRRVLHPRRYLALTLVSFESPALIGVSMPIAEPTGDEFSSAVYPYGPGYARWIRAHPIGIALIISIEGQLWECYTEHIHITNKPVWV